MKYRSRPEDETTTYEGHECETSLPVSQLPYITLRTVYYTYCTLYKNNVSITFSQKMMTAELATKRRQEKWKPIHYLIWTSYQALQSRSMIPQVFIKAILWQRQMRNVLFSLLVRYSTNVTNVQLVAWSLMLHVSFSISHIHLWLILALNKVLKMFFDVIWFR